MGKPGANNSNNTRAVANNDKFYNILFLGPTGVGKSTFINAFVNYLMHESLETARRSQPVVLIKSKFIITDDNLVEKEISVTSDANPTNESDILGDSATQESRVYTFPILGKKVMLRLIDTPGIGDTRGIDQDEINCDDILQKISRYDEIHAICILLKPNNARLTAQFEFCIKQLLSRLDKSATDNIIFIFTNSRSSFYRPGDTSPALQRLLQNVRDQPPHVDIPLKKENTFCMDNEAFRFLMAMKVVKFTEEETAQFARSWDVSREVCHKLLTYIMGDENNPGLKPHLTKNTVSINEARRLIMQLAKPLADISEVIGNNMYAWEQQMKNLKRENQSLNELKKNMFIPVIDIRETHFDQPRTVCADLKCTTTYTVQGKKKCHYGKLCHNPCYLRHVPREIIGSPDLLYCAAMEGTRNCKICGCSYGKHMHIYYETTVYETQKRDDNVASEITNREAAINKAKTLVKQMEDLKKEHEAEHEIILNSLATFAWFLKNNAITAYNDAYSTYVAYLIDREKSRGDEADQFAINHLQTALRRYEEYKKILDNTKASFTTSINAGTINDLTKGLFSLKHCGNKIKSLYDGQNRAHTAETENFEYVHRVGLNLTPEPPSQQTNKNKRNSNARKQNNGKNAQNHPNNNTPQKGQRKQQGNHKKNWRNPQQNQNQWQGPQPPSLFQHQVPPPYQPEHQRYNNYQQGSQQNYANNWFPQGPTQNYNRSQGPVPNHNNYQQGQPSNYSTNYHQNTPNYQHYPQGPQFNFSPGANQQTWPNQMNQGYHQNQQQQLPPPQDQQRYQQQYNRSGPSRRDSFHNEAGPSKETTYEAPTGVYNPKAKQNTEKPTNTQTLEQQFSSMNVQEPQNGTLTYYDNQHRNRNSKYNSNQQFHQIRGKNNFKKNQGRNHNSQQQGRNYSRNDNDDGENEDNTDSRGHGYREMRKTDLVKQTVALAVIEHSRPEEENGASGTSLVTVNEAIPEKAVSFFRKLFG